MRRPPIFDATATVRQAAPYQKLDWEPTRPTAIGAELPVAIAATGLLILPA
jgi:hypothetical protein